mmetsp:Transcript_102787/g.286274  ORF Transcript_102787/g.286274 Transcript_102787/m.286274 type:complete len:460 (+) Transcript_102787:23-1402(+)
MAAERTRSTAQATLEGLRVFIAGIPWKLDEDDIRRDFGECGTIEDLFLLRDEAGKSMGRAYITYQEKSAVKAALEYNETDYGGRKIFVKVAEPRKKDIEKSVAASAPKAPAPVKEKEFPIEKPKGCRSLCLKNIGSATEANVRKFLDGCAMQSVRIVVDRLTGTPRGIAFVDFKNPLDVDKAMEKNGLELKGNVVEMHFEAPRERPRPDGCMCVAIKKLPPTAQESDVRRLFNGLKSLSDCRVIMNKERVCTGIGFADFTDPKDVEAAVARDGMKVKGDIVFICYETKGRGPEAEERKRQIEARRQQLREEKAAATAAKREKQAEDGTEGAAGAAKTEGKKRQKKAKAGAGSVATNDAGAEPDDEGEVDAADAKKAAKFAQKRKDERARKAKRKGEKKDVGGEAAAAREGEARAATGAEASAETPAKAKRRKAQGEASVEEGDAEAKTRKAKRRKAAAA